MTAQAAVFLYGTLRHPPLLAAVLDRLPEFVPAHAPDRAARVIRGEDYPALVTAPGGAAPGILVQGLTAVERARLDYFEGPDKFDLRPIAVDSADGAAEAPAYLPRPGLAVSEADWDLGTWVADHGAAAVLTAREIMGLFGRMSVDEMEVRYPTMRIRAHSAVRAAREPAPTTLRSARAAAEIEILAEARPYTEFFALGEADLRFPRFDGARSPVVRRAAFLMGDAVTVLPYDPVRDAVLVVEQFRFGPFMRGDPLPWTLEPVAGRIDAGETPEAAARRETAEEAGLEIGTLHAVGRYYPSPAAVSEWLASFVGIADLPAGAARLGGLDSEAEDIRGHVVPLDRVLEMIASGEAANAPLILSAQWIALNRDRLSGG